MNILGKFFLSVLFFTLFLTTLVTTSIKFQLTEPIFWTKAFEEENVYPGLAEILQKAVIEQTKKEGGSPAEARALTDILSDENVKITFERNITNFLNYANGKAEDLLVYLPIEAAPPGLLPKNLALGNETSLKSLASMFGYGEINYSYIEPTGKVVTTAWFTLLALILLVTYMAFKATKPGKKFFHPAVTFIATSFLILLLSSLVALMQVSVEKDLLMPEKEPVQLLLGTLAPPLIGRIVSLWSIIAGALGVLGIILLFVRKPGGIIAKKGKK